MHGPLRVGLVCDQLPCRRNTISGPRMPPSTPDQPTGPAPCLPTVSPRRPASSPTCPCPPSSPSCSPAGSNCSPGRPPARRGPTGSRRSTPTAIRWWTPPCSTGCRRCASSATSASASITSTWRPRRRAASRSATRPASSTAPPRTWPSPCLLAAGRRLVEGDRYARGPDFLHYDPSYMLGREVHGSTLGIVGLGRIGTQVARRARGFDMTVLYHNRQRRPGGGGRPRRPLRLPRRPAGRRGLRRPHRAADAADAAADRPGGAGPHEADGDPGQHRPRGGRRYGRPHGGAGRRGGSSPPRST